ncbi:hypothetical protein PM082_023349 [Marasmius tenuissimus]|nr:hypothetical protein PM082_023349 [Marasmius tenuissimus]
MSSASTWLDSAGLETIKKVVARCIPQWPNGLYDYQLDTMAKVLNREHVLFISGTGSGKAALFMVPLLAHRELTIQPQPQPYPLLPVQENAVVVVVTPTKGLAASIPTVAVCKSLGLEEGSFHVVRRSNERENMYLTIEIMKVSHGVSKYAQLLGYLNRGQKTVIHVNTIPTAYEIYEFLWQHIPNDCSPLRRMRMYHSLCRDDYNRETFELIDSDPELQIIIATVAFTMGINRKCILDSISWNFPSTLNDYWQAKGRVGRQPDVVCRGVAIVPSKLVKSARDFLCALDVTKETKSSRQGGILKKKGRGKKAKSMVEMEEGKAKFLAEAWCYTAILNQYYGNSPSDVALGDCREANRTVFCSLGSAVAGGPI